MFSLNEIHLEGSLLTLQGSQIIYVTGLIITIKYISRNPIYVLLRENEF